MIPDFAGQTIIQIKIEGGLTIWTEENWELQLNGDTFLSRPGRGTVQIENTGFPDDIPEELQPLIDQQISSVLVSAAGALAVNIGDTQLSVGPDRDYEAWQLGGPRGELIICTPGGELTTWGPRV